MPKSKQFQVHEPRSPYRGVAAPPAFLKCHKRLKTSCLWPTQQFADSSNHDRATNFVRRMATVLPTLDRESHPLFVSLSAFAPLRNELSMQPVLLRHELPPTCALE
jgi:hypothetical protein